MTGSAIEPRRLAAVRAASLLFAFGLLLRLLFWQATPDRSLVHAACYQGDAPVWQSLAYGAAHPQPAVPPASALPFRPPGSAWHVALLWDGDAATAWRLRLWFTLLGALVAPLCYLALRRSFPERTAVFAGGLCAASTGLLQLGSGVHGEIPYLLLFLLSMLDWERLRSGSRWWCTVRWSLLHALATLCRAEHMLVFLGLLLLLYWPRGPRAGRTLLLSLVTCVAALLPWHLHAWSEVDRFNAQAPVLPPAAVPWTPDATTALRALPAFLQGPAHAFLSDTVRLRGGRKVEAADLGILVEAYGPVPGPLPHPFVALYGPLNFFLANHDLAGGGFSPAALDVTPPLQGGPERYPPGLLQVLPRDGKLELGYPPHVRYLTEGYRLGRDWLLTHPTAAMELAVRKLQFFWQGASMGLGGYGLPIGLSGTQRRVDLTTADGAMATAFRLLVLLLVLLGAFHLRRDPGARPWLWFLLVYLLITLAFFGYARLGALCTPVIALLLATAIDRLLLRRMDLPWRQIGLLSGTLLVLLEGARWLSAPQPAVAPPFGEGQYVVRQISYQ